MAKRKTEKVVARLELKSAAPARRAPAAPAKELGDDFIGIAVKRADAAYQAAKDNIAAA